MKLKKILSLASPLDNRLKAVKNMNNISKFVGYETLATLESYARGTIIGTAAAYLITGDAEKSIYAGQIIGMLDLLQHGVRSIGLASIARRGELESHLKECYSWREFI